MKPRDNLIRLKQFRVTEKHRQVMQLESMIAEFERMATELDNQIQFEEKKSGISDVNNFAYPTFAKAARSRVANLAVSIRDLQEKRMPAEEALKEAEEELKKAELKEARDGNSTGLTDPVVDAMVERRMMIG